MQNQHICTKNNRVHSIAPGDCSVSKPQKLTAPSEPTSIPRLTEISRKAYQCLGPWPAWHPRTFLPVSSPPSNRSHIQLHHARFPLSWFVSTTLLFAGSDALSPLRCPVSHTPVVIYLACTDARRCSLHLLGGSCIFPPFNPAHWCQGGMHRSITFWSRIAGQRDMAL
jgi:hypothetical protein